MTRTIILILITSLISSSFICDKKCQKKGIKMWYRFVAGEWEVVRVNFELSFEANKMKPNVDFFGEDVLKSSVGKSVVFRKNRTFISDIFEEKNFKYEISVDKVAGSSLWNTRIDFKNKSGKFLFTVDPNPEEENVLELWIDEYLELVLIRKD